MEMEEINQKAFEELEAYKKRGCHILIPAMVNIQNIVPGFVMVNEPILLNPHPRAKDVYAHDKAQWNFEADDWKKDCKSGNERVRLHKQGYDKLARGAGVDWFTPQLIRDPVAERIMATVEGMIRKSTGELYRVSDNKGMDLQVERKKLEFQYRDKDKGKREYLIERDLLQKMSYQVEMCISGARNRVVRTLLPVSNTYTVDELKLEFVVVRIIPRIDPNDPYERKRMSDLKIAAMAGIYGLVPKEPQRAIELAGEVPAAACADDVVDAEEIKSVAKTEGAESYKMDPKKPPTPADEKPPFSLESGSIDPVESLRVDFIGCDEAGQCRALAQLIQKGKHEKSVEGWLAKFKAQPATLQNIGPENRIRLYDQLTKPQEKKGK